MTPEQLKTQFETLIDDELDDDYTYQLMEQAKNKVEMELRLQILQDVDQTQTANSGDTYLSMKTLNENVRILLKLSVGKVPYHPCRFIDREQFRNSARRYYIDWKNRQFALCGSIGSSQTISQFFLTKTTVITEENADDASTIVWPDEFKPLIPYEMAKIYQGNIDADDISFRMSAKQEQEMAEIKDAMINWDAELKLQEMGGAGGFSDEVTGDGPNDNSDIGSM